MGILEKILSKDPLLIADDDHLNRKDISKEEFSQALQELIIKFDLKEKKEITTSSPFSEAIIEALNSLK